MANKSKKKPKTPAQPRKKHEKTKSDSLKFKRALNKARKNTALNMNNFGRSAIQTKDSNKSRFGDLKNDQQPDWQVVTDSSGRPMAQMGALGATKPKTKSESPKTAIKKPLPLPRPATSSQTKEPTEPITPRASTGIGIKRPQASSTTKSSTTSATRGKETKSLGGPIGFLKRLASGKGCLPIFPLLATGIRFILMMLGGLFAVDLLDKAFGEKGSDKILVSMAGCSCALQLLGCLGPPLLIIILIASLFS